MTETRLSDLARSRGLVSLPALVFVATVAATLALSRHVLTDQDPFWHIAAGNWIIEHRAVPHRDPFSYSLAGAPWIAHEWLAEVAIALIYDGLGWAGLVVMTALAFAAALALLTRYLLRQLAPIYALALVLGAWGLCLAHVHARPHVFSLPLLVFWFAALDRARARDQAPSVFLAPLMTLWANLHGGYAIGFLVAAFLGGEAVFEAPDRRRRLNAGWGWGSFLALSLLAAMLTPNGVEGLLLPLRLAQSPFALAMIAEWKSPDFQVLQPLELWMLLGLLGALTLGLRVPLPRIAMLLALLHMALTHRRFAEILGLVAPLVLASAIADRLRETGQAPAEPGGAFARPASAIGLALAAFAAAMLCAAFLRIGIVNQNQRYAPTAAVAFVQQHAISGPVFNDYEFGGYLIFSGIAPFVDGRADMYGDAFLKRYIDIAALPGILDQYHVRWTLLEVHDPRAVLLDYLPGWKRAYADDIAVVHARDGSR
jgi:hypothetical protein